MHLGGLGLALRSRSGGGGGGSPASGMLLGMNVGSGNTASGAVQFANLAHMMSGWALVSGSPTWSQNQGALTSSDTTSAFRAVISDNAIGMPSGIYTVTWAGAAGASFGVGHFSDQITSPYTTTQGTFTFNWDGTTSLMVWAKGSITDLRIIIPGHTASYAAGNPWNSQFLNFQTTSGVALLRLMDMLATNLQLDQDWSDRIQPDKISFWAGGGTAGTWQLPWEFAIDLANRLSKDVWINMPPRATDTYLSTLAALFNNGTGAVAVPNCGNIAAGGLAAARKAYVEFGNELIWNTASPFAMGTDWITYYPFTKHTATVDASTDIITSTAHGLVNNDTVRTFWTRQQRANNLDVNSPTSAPTDGFYVLMFGAIDFPVKVLTANTFQVCTDATLATSQNWPVGATDCIWLKSNEAGKVADGNTYYSQRAIAAWDAFTTAMGTTRVKRVLGGQAANTSILTSRLAVTGVSTRVDYAAIAPYFGGYWFAVRIDTATGQFTYNLWANRNVTVYASTWASGATPQRGQGMAGTGTLANSGAVAYTAGSSAWTSAFAPTGFTNGTTYKHLITVRVQDSAGRFYFYDFPVQTLAASATATNTYVFLDTATQGLVTRVDTRVGNVDLTAQIAQIIANQAVLGSVPLVCYEGGAGYPENAPSQARTWMNGTFQESAAFATVITRYINAFAAQTVQVFNYYGDVLGRDAGNVFSIANSYADTADLGYQAYAAFSGTATPRSALTLQSFTATRLAAAPSYPATVYALPAGYTYTILSEGAQLGNFTVSGTNLQMVAGTGVSFASSGTQTIRLLGDDGFQDNVFIVDVPTGPAAWNATFTDALIAWNSVTDTDNAAMNPDTGAVLSLIAGSGATIAGGMWDFSGTTKSHYANSNALTAGMDFTKPLLIVTVVDVDNGVDNDVIHRFGGFPRVVTNFLTNSGANLHFQFSYTVNSAEYTVPMSAAGTKQAAWWFLDAANSKVYYGKNQAQSNAGGGDALPGDYVTPAASTQASDVGNCDSKSGCFAVVNRAGMTITDVLAIVQNVQNVHGI